MSKAYLPETLEEALNLLHDNSLKIIAGGTDLMVQKRNWKGLAPAFQTDLLFINRIKELKTITSEADKLIIGSGVTLSELLSHEAVPVLFKQISAEIAAPAIRNSATLAGNICNASPAADTLPYLYLCDASLILISKNSQRTVQITDFITGPGHTVIEKEELLKSIIIPHRKFTHSAYRKVGTRKANALSKLSFLAVANINQNIITDFRASFGAVAPAVIRNHRLEAHLHGKSISRLPHLIADILSDYSMLLRPIDDQRSTAVYRKKTALSLLEAFLQSLTRSEATKHYLTSSEATKHYLTSNEATKLYLNRNKVTKHY